MKRGDKFKVISELPPVPGGEHHPPHLIEHELDDGAKATGVVFHPDDANKIGGAEAIPSLTVEPTGERDTYRVKSVHQGPSRASTQAFRDGWDGIFGKVPHSTELH